MKDMTKEEGLQEEIIVDKFSIPNMLKIFLGWIIEKKSYFYYIFIYKCDQN